MRKYQQLLLIIISIISIISLIQYRNEYLKLRYVLQVLNFFGSPNNQIDANCLQLNESFINSEESFYKYSDPLPIWYSLENHYFYSAFWESKNVNNGKTYYAKILTIGDESNFQNYQCRVWFDQGNSIKSKQGEFTYQIRYKGSSSQVFYFLFCEIPEPITQLDGTPYGVIIKGHEVTRFVPLFHQSHDSDNTVVCVKPDLSALPKSRVVEFISFYNIIGVQDFIIYDNGIQHSILHTIQALSGHKGFPHSVSIMPWNFPFDNLDLQDEVTQADCLSRSSDKGTTIVVSWEEYLVPKMNLRLNGLIKGDTNTKYETKTLVCCTEVNDDKATERIWPTMLRKTRCVPQEKRSVLFYHPTMSQVMKNEELPSFQATLHVYRTCDNEEKRVKFIYEPIMAKYLGKFMTDKLQMLWNSGALVKYHAQNFKGINLNEMV